MIYSLCALSLNLKVLLKVTAGDHRCLSALIVGTKDRTFTFTMTVPDLRGLHLSLRCYYLRLLNLVDKARL